MRSTLLALAMIAATALAGCGGSNKKKSSATPAPTATATQAPASSGGGGAALTVSAPADGSLKFDQSSLTAKAGKVKINFSNPAAVPHAVEIEGNGVQAKTTVVTNGKASVRATLKPGTYDYYCPVDGHRQAGMEGKLTVQ